MTISQLIFGLISGAMLVTLGALGVTHSIFDASLMIVGAALAAINVIFWMIQDREPALVRVKVSDTPQQK